MALKRRPISRSCKVRVALTMGDPSGIGAGIIAAALGLIGEAGDFTVIGDRWVFDKSQLRHSGAEKYKFIDLDNVKHKNFRFGKIRPEYGRAAVEYLDCALELINNGQTDCLVTGPICKESINSAGFNYSGHTEYLAQKTGSEDILMMLLNKYFRFSLVTRHISIKDIHRQITPRKLRRAIALTHKSLSGLFGIKDPRIAVLGLNPHASDNGLIGKEEERVIKPVLKSLASSIKNLSGPFPAEVAIPLAFKKIYDAVIAMYHDQALIPLKLSDSASGVNLTLGLPFVRTSPLHGTAFDIAGTERADPSSLIEAIRLAIRCTLNQKSA